MPRLPGPPIRPSVEGVLSDHERERRRLQRPVGKSSDASGDPLAPPGQTRYDFGPFTGATGTQTLTLPSGHLWAVRSTLDMFIEWTGADDDLHTATSSITLEETGETGIGDVRWLSVRAATSPFEAVSVHTHRIESRGTCALDWQIECSAVPGGATVTDTSGTIVASAVWIRALVDSDTSE